MGWIIAIIVGGVAGGMSCAARARRLDETAEIIVLDRGNHVSFANCGLPYFVGGEIQDQKSLLVQTPESLRAALAHYLKVKGRGANALSPITAAGYKSKIETYLADWLDLPLRDIGRRMVQERHLAIPDEIAAGKYSGKKKDGHSRTPSGDGTHVADQVFRIFRAVYNETRLLDDDDTPEPLPDNP